MTPGDYLNVKPTLASSWARTPDGKGWRFTMRPGTKFNSGNPVTVEDVKWSIDRVINVKDQPSQYVANVDHVAIVDPQTIDVMLKDPSQPLLTVLCGPNFGVMERKVVEAHGGTAAPNANTEDKATQWLNQNSAGAGPFTLGGLDTQCADHVDAQSALLAWSGAVRACRAASHGRQRDAASRRSNAATSMRRSI